MIGRLTEVGVHVSLFQDVLRMLKVVQGSTPLLTKWVENDSFSCEAALKEHKSNFKLLACMM